MKIRILLALLMLLPVALQAQELEVGRIEGKIVARQGRVPIAGATVTLESAQTFTETTDISGSFSFDVPAGLYTMTVTASDWQTITLRTEVGRDVRDLGFLTMTPDITDIMIDDFEENEIDFDSDDSQSLSTSLSASGDVFTDRTSFGFSAMRFRTRGYDQGLNQVYMNGVRLNDAMTGYSPWSLWSGLNDATRNQETTIGANITEYGPGSIAGSTNINTRASMVRKGFRASAVNANGQYRTRIMLTYASGELDNGWSYAFSGSTRQGGNDWVNGVFYNQWAYFGAIEKNFQNRHKIAFTFLGVAGERAVQAATTDEAYDLAGSNQYNPNWGYTNGKHNKRNMRNARVRDNHEPLALLNYDFLPNDNTIISLAASFRFGKNGYSALDWSQQGSDPRPDYYRQLPSYSIGDEESSYYSPITAYWQEEGWQNDWNVRQIDWQELYNQNWNNYFEEDGTIYHDYVTPSGLRRSIYIIEDRRTDQRDFNAKLQVASLITSRSKVTAGYDIRINRTEYYKRVKDLLGGDYYLDVDKYASDSKIPNANQSNVNTINRLVKKGDKFGYDYYAHLQEQAVWGIYELSLPQWQINLSARTGSTRFWREGRYKKGLFQDDSEGSSDKQNFWTYTAKASVAYRITSAHTVSANFSRIQQAPYFTTAFVSPRTRNSVARRISTEKITSVDLNYTVNLPAVKGRLTGYFTKIDDRMKLISFYDDSANVSGEGTTSTGGFVNYSLSGIDQMYTGIELGVSVPLTQSLTAEAVLNYGYYKYTSNPYVTQTLDSSDAILMEDERVYWKNMKIEGTPQTAASVGLNYRGRNNIYAGIDLNFFDATYIGMNPVYRTDAALRNLDNDEIKEITKQEKFHYAFVLNANLGKMWRFRGGYTLGMNLQVRNILNDKNIKTGGFEQNRLRKSQQEDGTTKYRPFDPKYYYMFGTTYYLNVYFRF